MNIPPPFDSFFFPPFNLFPFSQERTPPEQSNSSETNYPSNSNIPVSTPFFNWPYGVSMPLNNHFNMPLSGAVEQSFVHRVNNLEEANRKIEANIKKINNNHNKIITNTQSLASVLKGLSDVAGIVGFSAVQIIDEPNAKIYMDKYPKIFRKQQGNQQQGNQQQGNEQQGNQQQGNQQQGNESEEIYNDLNISHYVDFWLNSESESESELAVAVAVALLDEEKQEEQQAEQAEKAKQAKKEKALENMLGDLQKLITNMEKVENAFAKLYPDEESEQLIQQLKALQEGNKLAFDKVMKEFKK